MYSTEAEYQIWRIIVQVCASYMHKSESIHFLYRTYYLYNDDLGSIFQWIYSNLANCRVL